MANEIIPTEIGNIDISIISKKISTNPNIFAILGVQYDELKFSNFLSWILAPDRNHCLGSLFIKTFFKTIGDRAALLNRNIILPSPEELNNIVVYREKCLNERRRADIVIKSTNDCFICLIECKTTSGLSSDDQLIDYHDILAHDDKFIKYKNRILVYLTPDGILPYDDYYSGNMRRDWERKKRQYVPITFNDVLKCLNEIKPMLQNCNDHVRVLIEQFKDNLTEVYMTPEKEILDACRELYKKYPEEVKAIIQYAPSPQKFLLDCDKAISGNYLNNNRTRQIKSAFYEWRNNPHIYYWWIEKYVGFFISWYGDYFHMGFSILSENPKHKLILDKLKMEYREIIFEELKNLNVLDEDNIFQSDIQQLTKSLSKIEYYDQFFPFGKIPFDAFIIGFDWDKSVDVVSTIVNKLTAEVNDGFFSKIEKGIASYQ